jgi:hypothetical protein
MKEPWLRGEGELWISSPQEQGVHELYVNNLLL